MGASEHIKAALKDKNMTQVVLAKKLGMLGQTFRNSLSRNTMSFETVEKIADKLDCEVVLRDRHTGKIY